MGFCCSSDKAHSQIDSSHRVLPVVASCQAHHETLCVDATSKGHNLSQNSGRIIQHGRRLEDYIHLTEPTATPWTSVERKVK
eukprot:616068-Pleurochrysis_carterae.AAC.3